MNKHQGRKALFDIYGSAMSAVCGDAVVENYLTQTPITGDVYVVAIGKAATAMAEGAIKQLGGADNCSLIGGILITKEDHFPTKPLVTASGNQFVMIEGAHPVPDQRSLDAGLTLVKVLQTLAIDTHLLFLISGGASSLVELLPKSVSLQELQQLNHYLLASGLAIDKVNELRQKISLIKGGGLLYYLCANNVTALYISDVQGDNINIIGSGLVSESIHCTLNWAEISSHESESLPHLDSDLKLEMSGQENNYSDFNLNSSPQTIRHSDIRLPNLPSVILKILRKGDEGRNQSHTTVYDQHYQEQKTEVQGPEGVIVTHKVVAGLSQALQAASNFVLNQGLALNHCPNLFGELNMSAKKIALILKTMAPGILITGGEVTVALPENPGQGGRNQSLALAVATEIAGCDDIIFIAIGTDGTDGPGTEAGAMIDGETCERGLIQGLESGDHLRRADAGGFLEASGDLISSGPTGTNVMDLYIGCKLS